MGNQKHEEDKKKVAEIYNQIKQDEKINGVHNYSIYKIPVHQMVKFREVILYALNKKNEK